MTAGRTLIVRGTTCHRAIEKGLPHGALEEVADAENSKKKLRLINWCSARVSFKIPVGSVSDACNFNIPIMSKFCVTDCTWLEKLKHKIWSKLTKELFCCAHHCTDKLNWLRTCISTEWFLMHVLNLNSEIRSPSTDCGKALPAHAVKVKQTRYYPVCR